MDVAIDLILATLTQASLMLSVFLFFVMIIVILFGCLIYLAEQGNQPMIVTTITLPLLRLIPICLSDIILTISPLFLLYLFTVTLL